MATQVTVNGVPVEQHIEQQIADEINEVRQSENKIKPYRPVSKRIYRSNGVPVRKWNLPDYQNWAREPLIIVSKQVFPRVLKGDFATSGKSILGALELNKTTDKVKCHECGEYLSLLGGAHLAKHGISSEQYKERHGLARRASLCAPRMHQEMSVKRGNRKNLLRGNLKGLKPKQAMETRNFREQCPVQLPARAMALAKELGRTPSYREFRERYGAAAKAIEGLFGSYNGLIKQAGLIPRRNRNFERDELLERICNFIEVCGRPPKSDDFGRKGLLPADRIYKRVLGSWQRAVEMCA